jgi:hypothetical protein
MHASVVASGPSLLGFEDLVPEDLLLQQRDWYAANVMQRYGLPLNSRKTYTKDDWMTFLAATYFTANSTSASKCNQLFSGDPTLCLQAACCTPCGCVRDHRHTGPDAVLANTVRRPVPLRQRDNLSHAPE